MTSNMRRVFGVLAAAGTLCCLEPSFAATQIDFHPGQNLVLLALNAQGENNRSIVVTWKEGLSVIDAESLAISDLDSGRYLGPVSETAGPFFYYNLPVGASWDQIKSLDGLHTEVIGERVSGEFAVMGSRLVFTTRLPGQDIRVSDGRPQGTHFLLDPAPGWLPDCGILCDPAYNMPDHLHATPAGKIFFVASDGPSGAPHHSLWVRDAPAAFPGLPPMPVPEARVIFESEAGPSGSALTAEGKLVFIAYDVAAQRNALYATAGIPGDLRQLAVFPAGFYDAYRDAMVEAGGVIFFRLERQGQRQLWRSDGKSAEGTRLVKDFGELPFFGPQVAAGSRVYFAVDTPDAGRELWVSDGTAAGTRMLIDGQPGTAGGAPEQLRALPDRRLAFSLDDGVHGREPWITDGTTAGTRMIEDVRPGGLPSNPRTFVPATAADRLFFVADDATGRPVPSFIEMPLSPDCPTDRGCR